MSGTILTETRGFTPVIDALAAEVGLIPAAVYGVVWRHCQMRDGICKASLQTLADKLGCDRSTLKRNLKTLCDAGYIEDTTPDVKNAPHVYRDTGRVKIRALLEVGTEVGQSAPPDADRRGGEHDRGGAERPTRIPCHETIQEETEEIPAAGAAENLSPLLERIASLTPEERHAVALALWGFTWVHAPHTPGDALEWLEVAMADRGKEAAIREAFSHAGVLLAPPDAPQPDCPDCLYGPCPVHNPPNNVTDLADRLASLPPNERELLAAALRGMSQAELDDTGLSQAEIDAVQAGTHFTPDEIDEARKQAQKWHEWLAQGEAVQKTLDCDNCGATITYHPTGDDQLLTCPDCGSETGIVVVRSRTPPPDAPTTFAGRFAALSTASRVVAVRAFSMQFVNAVIPPKSDEAIILFHLAGESMSALDDGLIAGALKAMTVSVRGVDFDRWCSDIGLTAAEIAEIKAAQPPPNAPQDDADRELPLTGSWYATQGKPDTATPVQAGGAHDAAEAVVNDMCQFNGLRGIEDLSEAQRREWVRLLAEILDDYEGTTLDQARVAWMGWVVRNDYRASIDPHYKSFASELGTLLAGVRVGTITRETLRAEEKGQKRGGNGRKGKGTGGARPTEEELAERQRFQAAVSEKQAGGGTRAADE